MAHPFGLLVGDVPRAPSAWPTERRTVHRIVVPEDNAAYTGTDLVVGRWPGRPRSEKPPVIYLPLEPGQKRRRRAGPDGQPLQRSRADVEAPPPVPCQPAAPLPKFELIGRTVPARGRHRRTIIVGIVRARHVKAEELAEAFSTSARTIYRDISGMQSDGVPIVGAPGKGYRWAGEGHVETPEVPPAEPVYKGPIRAPGEMTYGQAARLIAQAKDGDLVDLQDLERAHATIAKVREAARAALHGEAVA